MDRLTTTLKTSFEFSHAVFGVFQLSLLMAATLFLVIAIYLASKLYNAGHAFSSAASVHASATNSKALASTKFLKEETDLASAA